MTEGRKHDQLAQFVGVYFFHDQFNNRARRRSENKEFYASAYIDAPD